MDDYNEKNFYFGISLCRDTCLSRADLWYDALQRTIITYPQHNAAYPFFHMFFSDQLSFYSIFIGLLIISAEYPLLPDKICMNIVP